MRNQSSVYDRNCRNRNRKNRNQKWRPKGDYVICVEENPDGSLEVWSTNSPFWRDFFKNES